MSEDVATVLVALLLGLVTGALARPVLRRLPEPELDVAPADGEEETGSRLTIRPVYEKVLYAELADRRFLVGWLALTAAVVAELLGVRLGWTAELAVVLVAVPAGTWLGYIDLRTTFLPTRLIYPTLLAVLLVVLAVGAADESWTDVRRALIGCALYGGLFYLLWWLLPGYGFGDVRLAFLLGLILGFLGWYELVTGIVLAQFLGGVIGGLLALLKLIDPRRNPFGPYLLVAALVGACYGPAIGDALGY
jgi:leader peptidase (prepilin peptidase)/N-methyltransferase